MLMVFDGACEGCQKHQSTNQTDRRETGQERLMQLQGRSVNRMGRQETINLATQRKHVLTLWTTDDEGGAGVGV